MGAFEVNFCFEFFFSFDVIEHLEMLRDVVFLGHAASNLLVRDFVLFS